MSALDLPGLAALRPSDVQQYIITRGWQRKSVRNEVARYAPPDDARGTVLVDLLLDTSFADYRTRMAELVDAVAAFESRPVLQVLDDLLSPPADVLRFRFAAPAFDSGLMRVDDAIKVRQASRQLLLSAAHAVIETRAHYPRLSQGDAVELLSSCQEGQTERGSYVSRLLIPVPPEIVQTSLPLPDIDGSTAEEPYSRKVTRTLMRALGGVDDAVKAGATEKLLALVDRGVSSNFLGALADLGPKAPGTTVELSVSWSRSRRPPAGIRDRVAFHESFFPTFREAASQLRDKSESPGTAIEGYVIRLESADLAGPGRIWVATKLEGRPGQTPVTVEVLAADYARAINAHKAGQRIRVVGTLKKHGRIWSLDQPTPFETIGVSAADGGDDGDASQ